MKITVQDPHALADAVGFCARAIPSRPQQPALAGIMLKSAQGMLSMSTYDFDQSAQASLEVETETAGRALVSGRLLADITKSLPTQPVTMAVEGTQLHVTCGRAKFSLRTMDDSLYPTPPDMPALAGTVGSDVLAEAVRSVAVAAGTDGSLPALTAVQMVADGDTLTLAATDRYRLAVRTLQWVNSGDCALTALVPARTLSEVAKSMTGADIHIGMQQGENGAGLIGFLCADRSITTRLIDGQFPKYESLFPTDFHAEVQVDVGELCETIRRVSLVAGSKGPIRLTFTADSVTADAGGADEATASENVTAELDGDGMTVALNHGFLLDALGSLGSDVATLSMVAATRPIVITGKSDALRTLLMPIRTSS
jgi:DNA polymerase-3 subunit beta